MMKHFKKLTLATTAALLLLPTTAGTSTLLPLPLPSITVGEEKTEATPQPEEPDIQPLVDEEDDEISIKKTH